MTTILAGVTAALAGIGATEALAVSRLVASFARRPVAPPAIRPPVTVLKPLHGDEPLLEDALASLCQQDYPDWQIVFGVRDVADPAVAVVRRLQARFPDVDIALVADATLHGRNRKVGNLINMQAAARHDILVIADADVHTRPDYLDRLVEALLRPGVGLVTTLYAGLPAPAEAGAAWPEEPLPPPVAARLGATQITHLFLPGAVLARSLGRQDCLGATMALRRDDLDRIGGFHALVDHLADDNVLGRRIAALGLGVALADTLTLTTVPETGLRALFRHELRWARTIRALEPAGFAASVVQYSLAWGLLTVALSGGALWSVGLFFAAWLLRAIAASGVDQALHALWSPRGPEDLGADTRSFHDVVALAFRHPVWLLPLRDLFSVAVMLASYGGRHVDWRGHGLQADTPPPFTDQSLALRPIERSNAR
ncbi:MAG TPA: bacteriohopanetetrol glucosamine biosynthesis glycosyltransferase HpnI [Rhodopila sp.]|jgi:ceramide glucosyltransferase|nr:bacteriohopanetetrol glucosamine biosynthesis glycosyltransferase HpnI [Rhodopila sp.]